MLLHHHHPHQSSFSFLPSSSSSYLPAPLFILSLLLFLTHSPVMASASKLHIPTSSLRRTFFTTTTTTPCISHTPSSLLHNTCTSKRTKCYDTFLYRCNLSTNWSKIGRGGGIDNFCVDEEVSEITKAQSKKYHSHGIHNLTNQDFYIHKEYKRVMIAVGANIGDRFTNLQKGIEMLKDTNYNDINASPTEQEDDTYHDHDQSKQQQQLIRMIKTSFLRETPPMYVLNQPSFLNGVIEIETKLSPHLLLKRLKHIESQIGRDLDHGIRNGPRLIDLDIIYYDYDMVSNSNNGKGGIVIQTETLQIPHPRMMEREFVLSPLCDIGKDIIHPSLHVSSKDLLSAYYNDNNQDPQQSPSEAVQVLPLPRGRMLAFNHTLIMGILNVTPDSFSDGGNYKGSVDLAVQQAIQMVFDGADIIDIGGESTRPGAIEVDVEMELNRTIPVIQKIREVSDIPISIDTRHSQVAQAAINAGADIVNDVSGGNHDPLMLKTVSELQVPIILMHMRGTPETMQKLTQYDDVVADVSSTLNTLSRKAEEAGISRWLQVLDPGIGFAKDLEQNLSLIKNMNKIRDLVNNCPLLLGPSRKGFIGKISGEEIAENRDFGTLAACLYAVQDKNQRLAPSILRVHNVKGVKQGLQIYEAISKAK